MMTRLEQGLRDKLPNKRGQKQHYVSPCHRETPHKLATRPRTIPLCKRTFSRHYNISSSVRLRARHTKLARKTRMRLHGRATTAHHRKAPRYRLPFRVRKLPRQRCSHHPHSKAHSRRYFISPYTAYRPLLCLPWKLCLLITPSTEDLVAPLPPTRLLPHSQPRPPEVSPHPGRYLSKDQDRAVIQPLLLDHLLPTDSS